MSRTHEESGLIPKMGHAFDGLVYAFCSEKSFLYLAVYFLLIGTPLIIFSPTITLKLLVLHLMVSSITIELLNTAIEITIDRISLEHNIKSKRAKDVASSASLWWHLVTLIIMILIAIRTGRDYTIWSNDFPELEMKDYLKQTFQRN